MQPTERRRANAMLLRRRRKVLLDEGTGQVPLGQVSGLLKNIESLGFTCSPQLVERLLTQSEAELHAFYGMVTRELRRMVGADRMWQPMYPNFPDQVMNAGEAELYLNALMHYLGDWMGLRIMPRYVKEDRPPLADQMDLGQLDLKVIGLGDDDELFDICRRLVGAKTSISAEDRGDVAWMVQTFPDHIERLVPVDIPHKENLGFITALLLEHTSKADIVLTRYFKTATDILRLATSMSDGDISLAKNTRYRSFKRPERRLLLALLDRCVDPREDMQRHATRWIRLGERLHPGEHRHAYPRAAAAFDALRNGQRVRSFNARVEAALAGRDVDAAVALLCRRPGELARRLDHLLRLAAASDPVLAAFASAAASVATPVLLQVMAHFRARRQPAPLRAFFPKGNVAKVVTIGNELPPLGHELCERVVATCRATLLERFGSLAPLGKVYIDPALSSYLVPFSQRSASKALRTLVRGSELPLPAGDTIRFFIWWREGEVDGKATGRVDIDLSAVMYNQDWNYRGHISWTNLRSLDFKAAHSGDITSAPDGACEFIDLDIPSVVRADGRYVLMSVLAYTSQPFCDLPECHAGWMARQQPGSGEVFEPATVVDKVDLAADTRICIPVILDLHARTLFWADLALRAYPNHIVTIESNQRGLVHLGQAITTLAKPDLHELFSLHAEARGTLVSTPDQADVVFSPRQGITPFEIDRIMADFL